MSDFPMTHDENDDPSPLAVALKPVLRHAFWHSGERWTITRTGMTTASLEGPPGRDPVPAALHEVLASRSEVELVRAGAAQLRSELTHQSALWQTALRHAAEQDSTIDRLQSELTALQAGLGLARAFRDDLASAAVDLTKQRDALADALEEGMFYAGAGHHVRGCGNGRLGRPPGDNCSHWCIRSRAALRLAGRLPREKS